MDNDSCLEEIMRRAEDDPRYLECKRELHEDLPGFIAVWDTLTEEQKKLLDNYIAAVELLETSMVVIAYEAGRAASPP